MEPPLRGRGNSLHGAARDGSDRRIVALLTRVLINLDQRDARGMTPLMIGAQKGHLRVVRVLLERGANVSIANNAGQTALHISCNNGHLAVTNLLLSAGSSDLEARAAQGVTPLHMATERGHSKDMRLLIKAGADLETTTASGFTALHFASREGRCEAVTVLIQAGADVKARSLRGSTPLHVASREGRSEAVALLIQAGADVKACNLDGYTSLHLAAEPGHSDVARLLTEAGADLETRCSRGLTPLHMASSRGHSEAIALLIKAGADVKACAAEANTPLHLAVRRGYWEAMVPLMEAGADLEAATSSGVTPLHMAAGQGHSEMMEGLIAAGANHDARTHSGETPLYRAALEGDVGAVRVLLRSNANPLLGLTGQTLGRLPLEVAALSGHSEVVLELIRQFGVEGCGGESRGVDALCVAAQGNHVDIMAMLVDVGVVDTGAALRLAANYGGEPPVKFLLQQQEGRPTGGDAYVNARNGTGATPLMHAIGCGRSSARVVRRLIDAGADTTSTFGLTCTPGGKEGDFDGTPVGFATRILLEKKIGERDATEEELDRLVGIRRLLLRVEAVHAMSWLWHSDVSNIVNTVEERSEVGNTSMSLRMTLPTLGRRARRRGAVLAPLLRYSSRSGGEQVKRGALADP